MITEVILPKLGQTMEEGAIVDWVKEEGDPVARGDVLFTVESDKAVLEVEATARGYLRRILVPAGQNVPVLTVVGLITREADEPLEGYGESAPDQAETKVGRIQEPVAEAVSDATPLPAARRAEGRIFASPRARKAAREKGIDLAALTGSGPKGRIVEHDVLDYAAAAATAAPAAATPTVAPPRATPVAVRTAEALGVDLSTVEAGGPGQRITKADVLSAVQPPAAPAAPAAAAPDVAERVPMAGVRRIVAERMAASHDQTARVTLVTEADATDFVAARERLKASVAEEWGFAPGFNDLLGLIVARALREFPYMNARLSEDGQAVERLSAVNLGLAVDTERGLLVPVIRKADQKGLRAFGTEFRELVERARLGRSQPDDLSGGTFTITSLGMYDIDAFTPIINLPEAAILGVGRIQAKAVVRDGEIVARHMWSLSLVFDHRLVDGAPAARFLQRIKQLIENPFLLLG
jgi:pyruvate dehydrogenase E2 component (dihydrolipoamide acetyltransferase)